MEKDDNLGQLVGVKTDVGKLCLAQTCAANE